MTEKHLFFYSLNPESIQNFLHKYDSHCKKFKNHGFQLSPKSYGSLMLVRPVSLISCSDAEQLKSVVRQARSSISL